MPSDPTVAERRAEQFNDFLLWCSRQWRCELDELEVIDRGPGREFEVRRLRSPADSVA
jgi:hypothetical protein